MNTALLFAALLTGMIYLAGCSKSNTTASPATTSLIGQWLETSQREQDQTSGTTTLDSTEHFYPGLQPVLTFLSNGQYITRRSPVQPADTGIYIQSGNRVSLQLSTSGHGPVSESILSLTANTLVLYYPDTTSTNPLRTVQYTVSYSR
jgi:hypothetical protein